MAFLRRIFTSKLIYPYETASFRRRLSSTFTFDPDTKVKLVVTKGESSADVTDSSSTLTFGELRRRQQQETISGDKLLVRIRTSGASSGKIPVFRFMSKAELDLAVKSSRKHGSHVTYTTELHGRVKV